MAVDPITAKILAHIAAQTVTDEQARKRLLITILAPVITVFLLVAFILYLITSPLSLTRHTSTQFPTEQAPKSIPVHFSRFKMLCYQGNNIIHCFKQLFVRRIRKDNKSQNNWTGEGFNLQPP